MGSHFGRWQKESNDMREIGVQCWKMEKTGRRSKQKGDKGTRDYNLLHYFS